MTDWERFAKEVERRLVRDGEVAICVGLTSVGGPYCPPLEGLMKAYIQVPRGLVWYGRAQGRVYWMWQPLEEA